MTNIFPGVYAISDMDPRLYVGDHDPFQNLDENEELQYLIELYPFSETEENSLRVISPFPGALALGDYSLPYAGGEVKERLSDRGFASKPNASDPNRLFLARVSNPLQFDTNILSGESFSGGSSSYGGIEIINTNGEYDRFFDYFWTGRRVVVKAGSMDFEYDQFSAIFEGSIATIEGDDSRIILTLQDNRIKTDKPVVSGVYGGTGGLDGMATLEGINKPLSFGVLKNIAPTLIDYANQIYQIHDGAIGSVEGVRDRGIELDPGGDVPDIMLATPGPNEYVTQLSAGYIKLGSSPAGMITADVHGETNNGSSNTARLALKILKTRLGVYSLGSENIDEASFATLAMTLTGDSGIFIHGDMTGSDVLDALLNNAAAYWTFNRQGRLFVGAVSPPGTSIGELDYIDQDGITIGQVIAPAWKIKVGYDPSVTVQTENDLAGGVSEAVLSHVTEPYRYVTYENSNTRLKNSGATERVFNTNLATKTSAEALLARLASIYGVKRNVYQVPTYKTLYRFFLGNTVKANYARYGMESGKNLMIVGVSESAATGKTVLSLWG